MESKKLVLIRILQIFEKYSDYNHPLTQDDILKQLKKEFDISVDRKAVGRNISFLKEAGIDIRSTCKGSFLGEREFTEAELRILIDSVLSSRHINAKYTKDLIEKICSLSNIYFRSHLSSIHSVEQWNKTENKDLFYNIELVDEAIQNNKKISFDYNKYGPDKEQHKTGSHTVSPYQLLIHNQRYYLMVLDEYWKSIAYYRLDHITNMNVSDEAITPITTVRGYEKGIDYKDISCSFPYLYTDKPETVEFIAEDENTIDQVIDWFGKDITIKKYQENKYKVRVKASPKAMEHWAMQYAGSVTVTSPASLVNSIKKRITDAAEKYNRTAV